MTLAILGFQLFDDAGLTTPTGGSLQLTHQSDLSDNPQDFVKYFGSNDLNRVLQAVSNPGVDNIVLTPTYILPMFAASTAYTLGQSIIPTTPNGYRYTVTTAGTTAGTEPAWGTTLNGTTTSGSAVFTLVTQDRPITEIILGLAEADLDTNTPGAPLSLGNTIDSGVVNAVPIYIRINNTITNVSSNYGTPELGIVINAVQQTSV